MTEIAIEREQNLADTAAPLDALPKTASGKIMKREIVLPAAGVTR